jgi:hypothetical protein
VFETYDARVIEYLNNFVQKKSKSKLNVFGKLRPALGTIGRPSTNKI